jgi:hypothetical protein
VRKMQDYPPARTRARDLLQSATQAATGLI